MPIETLHRNNLLRVQVYDYLQHQMLIGALKPGASISVNTMIKELKVSRTPLREALLLLQEQGFVTIVPQRGVKINLLTLEDVKDIYEILGGIESRVIMARLCRCINAHFLSDKPCLATTIHRQQQVWVA